LRNLGASVVDSVEESRLFGATQAPVAPDVPRTGSLLRSPCTLLAHAAHAPSGCDEEDTLQLTGNRLKFAGWQGNIEVSAEH